MTAHAKYLEVTADGSMAHASVTKAAMAEVGTDRQSALHPLDGKTVVYDGRPCSIFYAIGGRFICRAIDPVPTTVIVAHGNPPETAVIDDYPEPSGSIADLVANDDGTYTYTTSEG